MALIDELLSGPMLRARVPNVTPDSDLEADRRRARVMFAAGTGIREIARQLGRGPASVLRWCKPHMERPHRKQRGVA